MFFSHFRHKIILWPKAFTFAVQSSNVYRRQDRYRGQWLSDWGFLKSLDPLSVHHCCRLQITEKHGCLEARAYLLEKKGDVHGAFAGLLQVKHLNGEKHLKASSLRLMKGLFFTAAEVPSV